LVGPKCGSIRVPGSRIEKNALLRSGMRSIIAVVFGQRAQLAST